ncbi:MAG: hypothetical protein OXO54_04240, partial [Chloroflexota bacterium]|nr:hypothetical protein [Chloroflexota bacterium]
LLLGGAVGQHRPDDRNPESRFMEEPMTAELNALEIERRLTRIDAMAATIATKDDLRALETRLTRWMVGSVLAAAMFAGTIGSVISRFWT